MCIIIVLDAVRVHVCVSTVHSVNAFEPFKPSSVLDQGIRTGCCHGDPAL